MKKRYVGTVIAGALATGAFAATSFADTSQSSVEGPSSVAQLVAPVTTTIMGFEGSSAALSSVDRDSFRTATSQAGGLHDTPLTSELDFEAGRVIANSKRIGRWAVVPVHDGGGYCVRKSMPVATMAPTIVSCAPGLPESGAAWGIGDNGAAPGVVVHGLVTTAVSSVQVITSSGKVADAELDGGAFVWAAPNRTTMAPASLLLKTTSGDRVIDLSTTVRRMADVE